jgi:hypothetical protein
VFEVQSSGDLMSWSTLTTITNVSGMDLYTNTLVTAPYQFYRLMEP